MRAYAYDLLNFLRFLPVRNARLADVGATDLLEGPPWMPTGDASCEKCSASIQAVVIIKDEYDVAMAGRAAYDCVSCGHLER